MALHLPVSIGAVNTSWFTANSELYGFLFMTIYSFRHSCSYIPCSRACIAVLPLPLDLFELTIHQ